ncbi:sialate O-acetylesterase [Companilactobacillus sp. FL22-1]|uniref:sialate O-acetylesterase n=1 Tax=Companilactobacillus sp. FL22-1 TaxID=3373892 RepID=UPI0037552942
MHKLILNDIYTDGMVVPSNKTFNISGTTTENAQVKVMVVGRVISTQADATGAWLAQIHPLPNNIETSIVIESCGETVTINKVKTGLVLLLTGQSNIEFKFRDDGEYSDQVDKFDLKNVSFYNVPQLEYQDKKITLPTDLKKNVWQTANKHNIWEMSDIGYWMVKRLKELKPDMVVGIIDCYKGGTSASSWVPEEVLQSDTSLSEHYIKPFLEATEGKSQVEYDQELVHYNKLVKKHNEDLDKFLKENPTVSLSDAKDKVGHTPWPPPMTPTSYLRPNGLFHTMIEKVKDYSVNKVIWYQGENDAENADVYEKLLTGLVLSWRKLFRESTLPFYIIQLPGYADEPHNAWAKIRQKQMQVTQNLNDVHLISIADTGEEHNIHPAHKRIAGTRIGLIVSDVRYNGTPAVYRYEVMNNNLILFVDKVSALINRGKIKMMVQIDNQWRIRSAKLYGSLIVVNNISGADKIRYAYENYPECTIFNEIGAPLAPFEMGIKNDE